MTAASVSRIDGAVALLAQNDPLPAYKRLAPLSDAYATLVYENPHQVPIRVDLLSPPAARTRETSCLGRMRATPCTDDPALPTPADAREAYQCAAIIRYRPGKRCTFLGRKAGHRAFVKVFADARGAEMEAAAQRLGDTAEGLDFDIAPCLGWDSDLRALAHAAPPVSPIAPALLAQDDAALSAQLGHALALLPLSTLKAQAQFSAEHQLKRATRAARVLGDGLLLLREAMP